MSFGKYAVDGGALESGSSGRYNLLYSWMIQHEVVSTIQREFMTFSIALGQGDYPFKQCSW